MASKNDSASSPVSERIASASAGEVRGPVATMTLSHSGGSATISVRSISISGSASSAAVIVRGKAIAIDGERAAGRQLVLVGRAHHQRVKPAHFGMQNPDGACLGVVGAERVRANQFGKLSGLVHGGRTLRPHFMQHDRYAAPRKLPGRLGPREPAANDMNRPQRMHGVAQIRLLASFEQHAGTRRHRRGVNTPAAADARTFCMLDVVMSTARRKAAAGRVRC